MIQQPIHDKAALRVGMVSTYPPSRCGIARFAESLAQGLCAKSPNVSVDVARIRRNVEPVLDETVKTTSMEFDPESTVSRRAAARYLNGTDVVVLQHEYGIYGADDGVAVIDLTEHIERPIVSILHTVLRHPTARQRDIVESLAAASSRVVVPSMAARTFLAAGYDVSPMKVAVIDHGSRWAPVPVRPTPRTELISWGLLGPGKGLERAIRAVSKLRGVTPELRYRIVGQTHPEVIRATGTTYRSSLESLVEELDATGIVEFVDRYVGDLELHRLVRSSDVVIVPYDNDEQVCSGVVIDAVAAGRPVVATRFPHAVELLSDGAGLVVDHDADAMAKAIHSILDDAPLYEFHAEEARRRGLGLGWRGIAEQYARLLSEPGRARATA